MADTTKLLEKMKGLEVELRRSGKSGPADFFKNTSQQILNEKSASKVLELVEQISSMYRISQYGDFSYKEDELLVQVIDEAIAILDLIQ